MFSIGIPLVCTVLSLYVAWRATSASFFGRRIRRRYVVAAAAVLWAVCLLGRFVGHSGTGQLAAALELVGISWLASLVLLSVPMLAVDLITGFGLLGRRWAPSLRGAALVAGGLLTVIALIQGIRAPVVTGHEVRLPGLPAELDRTVIVAVSDTHLGNLLGAGWLTARVDQINQQRPDLVVFVGDILEGHAPPPDALIAELRRLTPRLGVWAVTGNHELHRGQGERTRPLEQAGIRVLRDEWVEVREGLVLAGVDDLTRRRRSGQMAGRVAKALAGRPAGGTVLLSHSPLDAASAAAAGAGLMLSGHTHGGQIWPLGYLVRLRYPLFAGRYEVDGMPVIVSRGAGTWGPRMRLWRRGEILRVTLRSASGPAAE